MEKMLIRSNSLLAEYDTIATSTLDSPTPTVTRNARPIKAHPGVNTQDILDEIQEIEDNIERGWFSASSNPILTTTLFEYVDVVVALTYNGFTKLSEALRTEDLRRNRYKVLAQELIATRDDK